MTYEEIAWKTRKEAPKDEVAINAELLIRAGYIDKVMAGVYSLLPLGLRVVRNIETIIRTEMERIGGQELLMPSLHPKESWEKTGRIREYDSLFTVASEHGDGFVLGPTHEEVITPLAQKYIQSYKDLPRYWFQIQNKFRDEKRAKSGVLRGREFLMKDLYSFHANEQDLDAYYEKVTESYMKIFKTAGIKECTYLTFASGGTFAKYSHEFQTTTPAGEDTIYICEACGVAVNEEIIADQKKCPKCGNEDLKKEKAIEVGNIFKLKTKFSKPFKCTYKDEKGIEQDVMMGCFGMGIQRLMGTIVEVHHDERGIQWPRAVAPFDIQLVELKKGGGEEWHRNLQAEGIRVLYDNREKAGAGEKLADADLMGMPWRGVISEKTGDKMEIKKRTEKEGRLVSLKEAIEYMK